MATMKPRESQNVEYKRGFKAVGLPMPMVKSEFGGTTVTFQRGYDVVKGEKNVTSDVGSDVVSNVGSGGSFGGSYVSS